MSMEGAHEIGMAIYDAHKIVLNRVCPSLLCIGQCYCHSKAWV
jgi:hypothetical protein